MGALAWILAIIGAALGADLSLSLGGVVIGAAAGFGLGAVIRLAERIGYLERRNRELEQRLQSTTRDISPAPPAPIAEPTPVEPPVSAWDEPQPVVAAPREVAAAASPHIALEPTAWQRREESLSFEPLFELARRFFSDGNVVVRVGIIVLFFGVAFLLKFAIDRQLLPIELRLVASALGAIGLIALGWRLREKRAGYALLVQGGGIGIFYLTVYAAAKLYHLLPLTLALLLMVAVVVLSSLLALWQNSRALAAFGISGGFLAPVLTSTGGGSHVLLFSYYALLNSGILAIAWHRAWRELNLLGFLFTFVIGTSWGLNYYQSYYFATTEPFLILFFLFYVAIAVLFALRQPLQLRGYVDGTLVFGVPIVAFALQSGLVHQFEYGLAISAFVLGALYITLASALWHKQREGMRLLCESFLALGVVFATLAIPLAFDGRWTSAAWALEGAALLWIGAHQQRLLPRLTGVGLQLAAGLFFLLDLYRGAGAWPLLNSIFLGAALISVAGLFSAFILYRQRDVLRHFEQWLEYLLLAWGVLWWFSNGVREIEHHLNYLHHFNATLLLFSLSAALLIWLWQRFSWPTLRYPLLLLLPVALLMALDILLGGGEHFFVRWGSVAWLALFAVQYRLLWRCEGAVSEQLLRFGHATTLWFLLLVVSHELHWLVAEQLDVALVWEMVAWVVPATTVMVLLGERRWQPAWPVTRFASLYQIEALFPVAMTLLLWGVVTLRLDGGPRPLPFIPLINPLELMQALLLMVVTGWWWRMRNEETMALWLPEPRLVVGVLGLLTFAWFNGLIAHAVHHLADVPYTLTALHRSVLFQTALSVSWTIVALLIMVSATRLQQRLWWMAGAGLLALTVAKLFFIDLARSGTVERIVSFLVVGALMLVIGYLSPLPPKQENRS